MTPKKDKGTVVSPILADFDPGDRLDEAGSRRVLVVKPRIKKSVVLDVSEGVLRFTLRRNLTVLGSSAERIVKLIWP